MRAPGFFTSLSAVLFFSLAGCSLMLDTDPPDPVLTQDSGAGMFDSGPLDLGARDAGPADGNTTPDDAGCTTSAQCDDGVFCNGVEECVEGSCVAMPVACPEEDGVACTHPSCDLTLDACVEKPADALCTVGEYCDIERGCLQVPDCLSDGDCTPPDACTLGVCVAGTCTFPPIDCATVLPALEPGDCRVIACDPLVGCGLVPMNALCDDLVGCTEDLCRADGSCGAEPRSARCDDGASCTSDVCEPSFVCGDLAEPQSGCRHVANPSACGGAGDPLLGLFPGLACSEAVCLGATALNDSGCGFARGCASGQMCVVGGVCSSITVRSCSSDASCNDGNPCNGSETCVFSGGSAGICAAALTYPCHPTPTGPTLAGTCALVPEPSGGFSAICVAPPSTCNVVPPTP